MMTRDAEPSYRRTEAGVIPTDWEVARLRELVSTMTNGFVGLSKMHYVDERQGVIYIQGFNVTDGGFNFSGIKHVSHSFHSQHQKSSLRAGDMLTIQTGDVGLTTVVAPKLAGANCHALIITRFKAVRANSNFYMRLFNSDAGRQSLRAIETGTTMKHLNVGDMLEFFVPVPPIAEQSAIVKAIDDVSELIGSIERMIAKKQAIKLGMMQQLLTGRTRLPDFADDWRYATLGSIGTTFGGLTGKSGNDFGAGDGRFVTFMDVMSRMRIDGTRLAAVSIGANERQNTLCKGDLVLNGSSETPDELAMASVVDDVPAGTMLNSFCFGFRLSASSRVDPTYVAYYLRGHPGRMLLSASAQGATRYNLSKRQFLSLGWEMPGLMEQRAIAAILVDADREIQSIYSRLKQIRLVKKGMLQELLTGRTRLAPLEAAA